jgi:hypothetical protein
VAHDDMSKSERDSYLRQMRRRYRGASRAVKGALLTEMEAVTGLHRKSLIRRLSHADPRSTARRPGRRRRVYGADVAQAVGLVWESLDGICAERLTPQLDATATHLARFGELRLTAELSAQLTAISVSTVRRILARRPRLQVRRPRAPTERVNQLRRDVPMRRIPWDTREPGHFEVDLVHHCGASAHGEYVHTLQLIDVATGWSERTAVLGRSQAAMEAGFRAVLARLPFAIQELHPDNGSEFFNAHLLRFFGESITGLALSRSRPYHKNDNRFVEQKNATLVRQYLGFVRLDTPEQLTLANQLYAALWRYDNLFQPVSRLVEKTIVNGRVRRRWDTAQTPYQRILESGVLDEASADYLAELYATTNPRHLRRTIYQLRDQLFRSLDEEVSNPPTQTTTPTNPAA